MYTRNRYLVVGVGLALAGLPALARPAGAAPPPTSAVTQGLMLAQTDMAVPSGAQGAAPANNGSAAPGTPVSGSIQLGGGYLNNDAYKFGEWTGVVGGGYPLANIEFGKSPAWDSKDPDYWQVKGLNLGLASRTVSAEMGKRGSYKLSVSYQGIPHYEWENARTPYTQVGASTFRLPSNFGGVDVSSATAWQTSVTNNLNPNLHDVDLKTYRDITRVKYTARLNRHWSIDAQFRHDEKEGRMDFGSVLDGNGFSPASVLLPLPISYKINQLRFMGNYHGHGLNMSFGYLGSFYNDNLSSYQWDSAFTGEGNWVNGNYPNGRGLASTPPDNVFHQAIFSGSWGTPFHDTHVVWDAAYGLEDQSAALLPYTTNPAITINSPLPTLNANAQVKTTQANLRLVTSPVERMEVVAALRYHDHADNNETFAFYPVTADVGNQASTPVYNLPYSYRRETAKLSLAYNFRHIRPFLRYRYRSYYRSFVAVGQTQGNRFTAGFNANMGSLVQMRVSGHYGRRHGTFYRNSFRTQLSETGVYNPAGDTNPQANLNLWTWDPLQQMFWFANRTRNGGQLSLNLTPPGPVTLTLSAQYNYDTYSDTTLGLLSNKNQTYSVELGYTPTRHVSVNAYGTYQRINWDQAGISFPGYNPAGAFDLTNSWRLASSQPLYLAGVNLKAHDLYVGLPNPVAINFNASYSYSSSGLTMSTGSALTADAGVMPDITMRRLHLGVTGNYHVTPQLALQLGVAWERYRSSNWHFDNISPGSVGPSDPVLTIGMGSPDYTVTWTTLAMRYHF